MGEAAGHRAAGIDQPPPHPLPPPPDWADPHDLAIHHETELQHHCGGCLGPVEWFRSTWQTSGAATGFASWSSDDPRAPRGAMVKLPVSPREFQWSRDLSAAGDDPPVARILACGESLGGRTVRWIVIERLAGKPLSAGLDEPAVHDLISTTFDFHLAAGQLRPVDERPAHVDWALNIHNSREAARTHGLPEWQRWNEALRHVQKALPLLASRWDHRPINTWCHGDVHPGNALRRATSGAPGRCVLVDLDLVHPGHWLEDAAYFERQYWGHPELLFGIKPISALAKLRRDRGLPVESNVSDLANIRRVLMASLVPLFVDREHNAKYMHAALELIEKTLPQIK